MEKHPNDIIRGALKYSITKAVGLSPQRGLEALIEVGSRYLII
jgi:hypothetical protein